MIITVTIDTIDGSVTYVPATYSKEATTATWAIMTILVNCTRDIMTYEPIDIYLLYSWNW